MRGATARSLVNGLSESVPGTSIAAAGFGSALYTYEVHRMSSFASVPPGNLTAFTSNALLMGILLALALVYKKQPRFRLHRHPWVGFSLAGAISFSPFLSNASLIPLSPEIIDLVSVIQHAGELLLLLCWAEVLLFLPSRFFATMTALSMLVLGLLNALSSLFKQSAILTLIALIPLLSMACLYWFKDKRESFDSVSSSATSLRTGDGIDATIMPHENTCATRRTTALLFLAPLVGYPFIFGHVHYAWIPFQDGSQTSLAIQLAAAAGTILAALLLLVLTAHFWGRRKIDLYSLFILPLLGVTLYLTGVLHDHWVFLYVIPLNICQKMVLFLAMLTPYLIPPKKSPLSTWCIAFLLYTLGKALSTSVSNELDTGLYVLFVIVFILLLTTTSMAGVIIDDDTLQEKGMQPDDGTATYSTPPLNSDNETSTSNRDPLGKKLPESDTENAIEDIAREYRLTRREGEILSLLAKGMTATLIAEELVVSTSTAKTHMRNIYQKLGVHTQSELLLLVHRN